MTTHTNFKSPNELRDRALRLGLTVTRRSAGINYFMFRHGEELLFTACGLKEAWLWLRGYAMARQVLATEELA